MQLHDNARGLRSRLDHRQTLICGLATAVAFGAFGAGSAQASDDFRYGFEGELGRVLAWGVASAVFNAQPVVAHHVPEVRSYYDSRGRRHSAHHHRARHYDHPKHVYSKHCSHRDSHWKSDRRTHEKRYRKHRGHYGYHQEHGDRSNRGPGHGTRRNERHS